MARGDFSCLKNINLALPRERRRSITGSNDGIFGGGNVEEVLNQQKETTGYDCGDRLDCFANEMSVPDTYLRRDSVIKGENGQLYCQYESKHLVSSFFYFRLWWLLSNLR